MTWNYNIQLRLFRLPRRECIRQTRKFRQRQLFAADALVQPGLLHQRHGVGALHVERGAQAVRHRLAAERKCRLRHAEEVGFVLHLTAGVSRHGRTMNALSTFGTGVKHFAGTSIARYGSQ
mgnify:CR=1 FL=1